jgi:hypothetical protein
MSEREEHKYVIKKGDVEIRTSDKELAYKFLGIQTEAKPPAEPVRAISLVYKPKIRETEKSYVIGDAGSVSKDCVSDVHNAVIRNSVGKPYITRKEIDSDENLKKWSAAYKSRALSVLAEKGKIKRMKLSERRNKYGYSPITPFEERKPSVAIIDAETKKKLQEAEKERRLQSESARESLK